jgi:hypothetical protein
MTQSGPVLAYHTAAPPRPHGTTLRAALEALLSAHDLELAVTDRPGPLGPVLRVLDRRTGVPPVRIPEAVAGQLARWVADQSGTAVA